MVAASFLPHSPPTQLKGGRPCLGNRVILLPRSATYTDRTDDLTVPVQWYAPSENHYSPVVRGVDTKELGAWLRMSAEVFRRNVECARGKGFVDGNINAAEPCAIHANVSHEVCPW